MATGRHSIAAAASPADLSDVRALFRAYAAALDVDLAYQGFEEELAGLPGRYATPCGALLIARDTGGRAAGCAAMRPMDVAGAAEMKRLYVQPETRGTGLGRRLAESVIAAARMAGYAELKLDTLPSMTGALALYRALGFVEIAPYYETPIAGTRFLGLRLS